jgi:hypothetical protein
MMMEFYSDPKSIFSSMEINFHTAFVRLFG